MSIIRRGILIFVSVLCFSYMSEAQGTFVARRVLKETAAESTSKVVSKTVKEVSSESIEKAVTKAGAREVGNQAVTRAVKKEGAEIIQQKLGAKAAVRETASEDVERLGREAAAKAERKEASQRSIETGLREVAQQDRIDKYKRVLRHGYPNKGKIVRELYGREALDVLDDELRILVEKVHDLSPAFLSYDKLVVKEEADGAVIIMFKDSASSIRVEGRVVQAYGGALETTLESGAKIQCGQTNQFLRNSLLLSDMTYELEDGLIRYVTNSRGEVVKVLTKSSDLYKDMAEKKIFRSAKVDNGMKDDLNKSFGTTGASHDYGHLVSRELGGLDEGINALPMKHELQGSGSDWRRLEELEAQACKNSNVTSEMTIKRTAGSNNFEISVVKTIDGKTYSGTFTGLYQ